jgi:predicted glycosyltransferase
MGAHHDVGEDGLSAGAKRDLVTELGERGPVYVSTEGGGAAEGDAAGSLPAAAEPLPVPPEHLHDLLAAADLFVTDAATTATEAGLLGTPTVRVGTFGGSHLRNFVELERYGLVRSTPDEAEALALARTLADDPGADETWNRRREELLADTVDIADFAREMLVAAGRPGGLAADAGPAGLAGDAPADTGTGGTPEGDSGVSARG